MASRIQFCNNQFFDYYIIFAKINAMSIVDKNLYYIGGVVRDKILGQPSF